MGFLSLCFWSLLVLAKSNVSIFLDGSSAHAQHDGSPAHAQHIRVEKMLGLPQNSGGFVSFWRRHSCGSPLPSGPYL